MIQLFEIGTTEEGRTLNIAACFDYVSPEGLRTSIYYLKVDKDERQNRFCFDYSFPFYKWEMFPFWWWNSGSQDKIIRKVSRRSSKQPKTKFISHRYLKLVSVLLYNKLVGFDWSPLSKNLSTKTILFNGSDTFSFCSISPFSASRVKLLLSKADS